MRWVKQASPFILTFPKTSQPGKPKMGLLTPDLCSGTAPEPKVDCCAGIMADRGLSYLWKLANVAEGDTSMPSIGSGT